MQAKLAKTLGIVLGMVIMGAGIYSVMVLITSGILLYNSLSEGSKVAIALGIISLISTIGSIVYTKLKEKKLQIEAANTSKKQKLYAKFTGDILDLIANPELGKDEEHTRNVRLHFMKNSMLWANSDVVKAYQAFRINSQLDGSGERTMWDIATLFLDFRKDLGLSNKGLNQHVLMEIIFDISDLETFYDKFPKKK